MNLLNNSMVKSVLKSSLYPKVFQWLAALVFGLIMATMIFGYTNPSQSFGIAVTWVLWWPLIPLTFFLMGRFWCAVCPFGWVSDIVQKYFGTERPVPPFLRKYGLWIIDIFFIMITWSDHVWGIVESPRGSGYLLLIITGSVILMGALFKRRAFCRYVCFIGGLSGNYSRSGLLALRAKPDVCKTCTTQSCYKGTEKVAGCPMFEFPRNMKDSSKCNFCANCIKACPNDSISITLRKPTSELWNVNKPRIEEVFLACIIMGIVLIQNVTMLSIWPKMLAAVNNFLGTDSFVIAFTVLFVMFMATPVLALLLFSWLSGALSRDKVMANFTIFGYAIIPLDLAAHMAHNLFHLLSEFKAIAYATLSLFGIYVTGNPAIAGPSTIFALQVITLLLGSLGSVYVAYAIGKNRYDGQSKIAYMPHALFIVAVLILNVYTFTLPMGHRV